ncbi:MAG: 3-dehydroquinate synthase [Phycisphaerales bacterium]|nr:3-dehydroquinate synthase [Phycisphaerales bacterium]
MTTQQVICSGGQYDILIEGGALAAVGPRVRSLECTQALLVADAQVAETHAAAAADSLAAAGCHVTMHTLPAHEVNKTMPAVESIWAAALAAGLDRSACMVAVGGGLIGDIAGFAAASFLRGVDFVQVPTTLLSMVDASVGGKTGINVQLPSGELGKNLAGAFWQPRVVIADPLTLSTLPLRERRCGLAEVIKHALIGDPDLLVVIEQHLDHILAADPDVTTSLIDRAVRVKVDIVQQDEREHGCRALLNLGHTFAHAIEPDGDLGLKHGEAVSIGLMAAAALSEGLGRLEGDWVPRLQALLEQAGLPARLPAARRPEDLVARMRFDKKIQSGSHRLIIPIAPGQVEIIDDVPEKAILEAWDAVIG